MIKYTKAICFILITIAICLSFNVGHINAFFQDKENIPNKITIGNVETEIIEEYDVKPIIPGEEFKKIVKVKNTGNSSCFVRVKVEVSPEEYKDDLALNIDANYWEYKDGYYYYNSALQPNKETTPLFTKLHIPNNLKSGDVFDVNVYCESIQSVIFNSNNTKTEKFLEIFEKI
jgi:hypothetical protein